MALRGPGPYGPERAADAAIVRQVLCSSHRKFVIRRKMMGISYAIIDCVYESLYVFEAFYVFAFLVHRC